MNGKILVVEDDDKIRRLLVDYLEQRSDLTVTAARDGVDALHAVAVEHVDVVVLDLMMPLMSGVDFLVSISSLAHDPSTGGLRDHPAVIVITGAGQDDVPNDTMEHRFPDFVRCVHRKPLDMPDLAACVEAQLGKQ